MIQILIVDDEKPICDLIQMSLTRAGYHCMCVYDGLAAADILERNVFDLILLDVCCRTPTASSSWNISARWASRSFS